VFTIGYRVGGLYALFGAEGTVLGSPFSGE
jgi:hypothetical protein